MNAIRGCFLLVHVFISPATTFSSRTWEDLLNPGEATYFTARNMLNPISSTRIDVAFLGMKTS